MNIQGPDFIALQWPNLDQARQFYHETLGLKIAPQSPPDAIVFQTKPIPFAVRKPLHPLDTSFLGEGVALWFKVDNSLDLLAHLKSKNIEIVKELNSSPFGQTFTFRDPIGHLITVHDKG